MQQLAHLLAGRVADMSGLSHFLHHVSQHTPGQGQDSCPENTNGAYARIK